MPHLTKSWAWALLSSVVLARLVAGCASGTMVVEDVGPRPDTNADMGSARDARADTGRPTTCMIAADCDDHDMCNGTEQCVANRCTIGTPVTCADTVPCTTDRCDPGDGTCSHVPDDVICGAGLMCDRVDGCIAPRACTVDSACDDHVFCNGVERCDLAFGCRRGSAPTCDDGHACTVDTCDTATDACASIPDDTRCSDSLVCNGPEVCAPTSPTANGEGCTPGTPLVCDDGIACTSDRCDEAARGCTATPDSTRCDDGVFCNGAETCDAVLGACQPGTTPTCDDAIGCSVGRCDTTTDRCTQVANDAACSDSRACNGMEHCDITGTTPGAGCVSGAPVDCSDGMVCTTDSCAEPGTCAHGGSDADGDTYQARGCGTGNDCDDLSPRINPGATEICDGIDNDCSGTGPAPSGVDDGAGMQCPFGSGPRACTTMCGTAGTQPCDGACHLGLCRAVAETCNGCDDDGDGQIDEPGGGSPVQCRAGDVRACTVIGCGTLGTQTCNSGCDWARCVATEICNGCDDDGDGMVDDGFALGGSCTAGIGECARNGTTVCRSDGTGTVCSATPGAPIAELCNARDDNCNTLIDEAFTELGSPCSVGVGACRRTGAFICRVDTLGTACSAVAAPPGVEICNGIDDDCDGTPDDGADGGACDGMDTDLCAEGTNRCMSGALVCDDATGNNVESCNGIDDNCNGTTDEGCACTLGSMTSCYGGPPGTAGVGLCRAGTQTCVAGPGGVGSMLGPCTGAVTPVLELCNGLDDDCMNGVDDGNPGGGPPCDGGDTDQCIEGFLNCVGGAVICSDMTTSTVEACNGIDDDCVNGVDDGNPGGGVACDGPDGDSCLEGVTSCISGSIACSDATSTTVEICNNLDDDCAGGIDNGNPGGGAACDGTDLDLCLDGIIVCTAGVLACNDGASSTTEICNNSIDDDCNPATPDACVVPGDHCSSPIVLSGTGGSRMDTLVGASTDVTGCGGGVDIMYSVTVSVRSLVFLSTFATPGFDSMISYHGTVCTNASIQCVDDPCTSFGPAHLAQIIDPGTHFFAVHNFTSAAPAPYGLTYVIAAAGGGTNTAVTLPVAGGTASFSGTTVGAANLVTPNCGNFNHTAGENSYFWMQCPVDTRAYSAALCGSALVWDSVVHMRLNGNPLACDDDSCGGVGLSRITSASSSGDGVVQVFVDGYQANANAYTLALTF